MIYINKGDESMNSNVIIHSGRASLEMLDEAVFMWPVPYPEDGRIYFTEAYRIESSSFSNYGLNKCIYSVMGRRFQDLSFADGETIQKFDVHHEGNECEIRKYTDGTKFLYIFERVPIFDSYDAEWGDRKYTSVYADINGVNMIHTYCGYNVGSIEIYLGLKESISALDEYLKYLDVQ